MLNLLDYLNIFKKLIKIIQIIFIYYIYILFFNRKDKEKYHTIQIFKEDFEKKIK